MKALKDGKIKDASPTVSVNVAPKKEFKIGDYIAVFWVTEVVGEIPLPSIGIVESLDEASSEPVFRWISGHKESMSDYEKEDYTLDAIPVGRGLWGEESQRHVALLLSQLNQEFQYKLVEFFASKQK